MSKIEDNKTIVGRWFTDFWGANCNLAIVDELAAPAQGSPHFGLMLSEMEESEWGCWIGRMNQEGHVVVGFVPGFGSP